MPANRIPLVTQPPQDTKSYAYKDGKWVEIPASDKIVTKSNDGFVPETVLPNFNYVKRQTMSAASVPTPQSSNIRHEFIDASDNRLKAKLSTGEIILIGNSNATNTMQEWVSPDDIEVFTKMSGDINIAWTSKENDQFYEVFVYSNGGKLNSSPKIATTNSYSFTGLSEDTTYNIAIRRNMITVDSIDNFTTGINISDARFTSATIHNADNVQGETGQIAVQYTMNKSFKNHKSCYLVAYKNPNNYLGGEQFSDSTSLSQFDLQSWTQGKLLPLSLDGSVKVAGSVDRYERKLEISSIVVYNTEKYALVTTKTNHGLVKGSTLDFKVGTTWYNGVVILDTPSSTTTFKFYWKDVSVLSSITLANTTFYVHQIYNFRLASVREDLTLPHNSVSILSSTPTLSNTGTTIEVGFPDIKFAAKEDMIEIVKSPNNKYNGVYHVYNVSGNKLSLRFHAGETAQTFSDMTAWEFKLYRVNVLYSGSLPRKSVYRYFPEINGIDTNESIGYQYFDKTSGVNGASYTPYVPDVYVWGQDGWTMTFPYDRNKWFEVKPYFNPSNILSPTFSIPERETFRFRTFKGINTSQSTCYIDVFNSTNTQVVKSNFYTNAAIRTNNALTRGASYSVSNTNDDHDSYTLDADGKCIIDAGAGINAYEVTYNAVLRDHSHSTNSSPYARHSNIVGATYTYMLASFIAAPIQQNSLIGSPLWIDFKNGAFYLYRNSTWITFNFSDLGLSELTGKTFTYNPTANQNWAYVICDGVDEFELGIVNNGNTNLNKSWVIKIDWLDHKLYTTYKNSSNVDVVRNGVQYTGTRAQTSGSGTEEDKFGEIFYLINGQLFRMGLDNTKEIHRWGGILGNNPLGSSPISTHSIGNRANIVSSNAGDDMGYYVSNNTMTLRGRSLKQIGLVDKDHDNQGNAYGNQQGDDVFVGWCVINAYSLNI